LSYLRIAALVHTPVAGLFAIVAHKQETKT